jgi:GDP-mannose 6-dehydrogenase
LDEDFAKTMRVSVFGLGYVGAVTAGCLTADGHEVTGVDVRREKVDALERGESPVIEPGLADLMSKARNGGLLQATSSTEAAVMQSDVSFVCVGTPSLRGGGLNLEYVANVLRQIAAVLRANDKSHVIILRSTMPPGGTRALVTEHLGDLLARGGVSVCLCPEFLREGSAVADFRKPSLAVLGTRDGDKPPRDEVMALLGKSPQLMRWETAEMVKLACNGFHALKVGFANEIGRLCKHLGEDGTQVMEALCQDTRLNLSAQYLRPGNPYGGSCLPKDVAALCSLARQEAVSVPVLENVAASNQTHLETLLQIIESKQKRRVGILGLAFKADTDDLRGSPMVAVAETLLGRGYEVRIHDPLVDVSRLIGANEAEMQRRMPHLARLLVSEASEVVKQSDVIVASQRCADAETLRDAANEGQHLVDVNGWPELRALPWKYEGLCW